jgi:CheY-like chemotaxis protein
MTPLLPPSRTAIYVEDNAVNALLMQAMFEQIGGWSVELFDEPVAALARVRECRPALLLLDLHLGSLSGLDMLAALRADPATAALPCVAVSGDVTPDAITFAMAAGFNGYWTKPIDLHEVARQLANFSA